MRVYFGHQILLSAFFGDGVNWQNVTASVTHKWMGMVQRWNGTDRGKTEEMGGDGV